MLSELKIHLRITDFEEKFSIKDNTPPGRRHGFDIIISRMSGVLYYRQTLEKAQKRFSEVQEKMKTTKKEYDDAYELVTNTINELSSALQAHIASEDKMESYPKITYNGVIYTPKE